MSKNIPKPIVRIGHSTKKNGTILSEIDGNKIKNMSDIQFRELKTEVQKLIRKLAHVRARHSTVEDGVLSERQYEEVESLIKDGGLLRAVKYYKEITGVGLKEAKEFVDGIREYI